MEDRKTVVGESLAPKKIAKIQFGTLSTEDIQRVSVVHVSSNRVYEDPGRIPVLNGCMDSRMGINDKVSVCKTCHKKGVECAGHFGYIRLELPVFHAGYLKHTVTLLQCICKRCSRILLSPTERQINSKRLSHPKTDAFMRGAIFKKIVVLCKKQSRCWHCQYANGVVKKIGSGFFKIVHEKFRAKNAEDQAELHMQNMKEIIKSNPDLQPHTKQAKELLTPLRAYELLAQMEDEDMRLLWMDPAYGRPDTLIVWAVPVPPVPIRPSVPKDTGGSQEDDLTGQIRQIIDMNQSLKIMMEQGSVMSKVIENWEMLQIQVALLVNGAIPGIPRVLQPEKPVKGLCQRLKGKQGRFRGNLSGKRVDFSARTVISPDPNLKIDQVGVPILVAKKMTYPEMVNRFNIDKLRRCVLNGPDKHPGANMVKAAHEADKRVLLEHNKESIAVNLKIGDIVDRHMQDDDVVLFNRQPSLHRMSIMAHRAKIVPWRTFRFNECCCTPYNADFDGDEMNMHLPQTEEAKAEAGTLMIVSENLITPRNGEPLIAATQDFLTGAYLLTQKDVFLTRADFCRLVAFLSDALESVEMPPPTIIKPRQLWTGKQVITMLVRPNTKEKSLSLVNLESTEKFYVKEGSPKHFCPQDGFVAFRRGELISGNLGKKTLGGESKSGLFYVLIRDYGAAEATRCMSRLAKLCARFLGDRGFSIGVSDVTPSPKMVAAKAAVLQEWTAKATEEIDNYRSGKMKLLPGCDALQSLENNTNGFLGKIREECGKKAIELLYHRNSPLCMSQCGSKGSPINISQMMACLGQQNVGGVRIQNGFVNRTLPHFEVGSLTPSAKGFVVNSFYSGLTATEFFFHTMGGREGLVDTAVKTAETGYMARRVMKALEDLSMAYDSTVRNSEMSVVQFVYGDDGLNPSLMENGDRPVDYDRLMVNVCSGCKRDPVIEAGEGWVDETEEPLTSSQIRDLVAHELLGKRFTRLKPEGQKFLDESIKFFDALASKLERLEELVKLGTSNAGTSQSRNMTMDEIIHSSAEGERHVDEQCVREKASLTVHQIRCKLAAMSPSDKAQWIQSAMTTGTPEFAQAHQLMRDNVLRLTRKHVHTILNLALIKYNRSMVEAGEAVGAVGAQSIAEPATQMTLKTFHFAGVASMNVTLGVPRLKEIINATKNISTPVITAPVRDNPLMSEASGEMVAQMVKGRIEKTTLGDVIKYIEEVLSPEQSYICVKLDMYAIHALRLNVNANTVRQAILYGNTGQAKPSVLRLLKEKHVIAVNREGDRLHILPPDSKETNKGIPSSQRVYFTLQALKMALPTVIVQGIPTVSRGVIDAPKVKPGDKKRFEIFFEGTGFADVMGCEDVDGLICKSNSVIEVREVLGIEAARSTIASEIFNIMDQYGIKVDPRHLTLLSDVMTVKGEVLGITRFGVTKMRESVLMLASFETPTDHLFNAAVHSREDAIVGVSECIIMGVPIPIGTGLFKIVHKPYTDIKFERRKRLMELL